MKRTVKILTVLAVALLGLASAGPAAADGGVTFTEIGQAAGVSFERAPTPSRMAVREAILASLPLEGPVFFGTAVPNYTMKPFGVPGVALLDYDGDGDLDIYVTNGPDTPNSLYSNQFVESGSVTFVDVALAAGVDATSQDSSGVCFGDIDNDGDEDLYVLAIGEPYRLFRNNGDGTFTDITDAVTAGQSRHANGCSMADVNHDGLLDIYVGNSWDDWNHRLPSNTLGPTYPNLEHNFLFLNQGGGTFADVSAASGIENVSNMNHPGLTGGAQTWAVGTFDFDQDGDTDILSADNQGARPQVVDSIVVEEERRGWLRLFQNDGSGQFNDITVDLGLDIEGGWMGLAFGDYNCDGHLDFFCTNIGSYLAGPARISSFFYYDGTRFNFAGPDIPNGFGWGASPLDYDNDGDLDVIYHGSVERLNFIAGDNPGILIQNQGQCSGTWDYDVNALTVSHSTRNVHGVAVGDLNNDGFPDIVTASAVNVVPDENYVPFAPLGSALDPLMFAEIVLGNVPDMGGFVVLNENFQLDPGNVTVELNNAENGNGWIRVTTRGSVGDIRKATVNRDGIGAVVKLIPENGPTVTRPVVGGSSYASQDARVIGFGLGSEKKGDLEVLWPGGVRNSLIGVRAGESVLLPEIPCSFDTEKSFDSYNHCVTHTLRSLVRQKVIPSRDFARFYLSAVIAYFENH